MEASRRYLCSYVDSLLLIKQNPVADTVKGKSVIMYDHMQSKKRGSPALKRRAENQKKWTKPPPGWMKLNVDGAWEILENRGGVGMILRDEKGHIIVTTCSNMEMCVSPLEAEAIACNQGIALALQHTNLPFLVESDCLVLTSMVQEEGVNRSSVAAIVNDIKKLCRQSRVVQVKHVSRHMNEVSHLLAKLGCKSRQNLVWNHSGPDVIVQACNQDISI
jgi:ribonuclease HI